METTQDLNNPENSSNDEISLLDVFDFLKDLGKTVWLRKYWIIACTILCIAGFWAKYRFLEKITYNAEFKITLNENKTSSALSGLMGGLGFLGGEDMSALGKVQTIMQSQQLLSNVLLRKTTIPCKNGILANCFLDSTGGTKGWKKSDMPMLRDFTFFTHTNIDSCTDAEWLALGALVGGLGEKTIIYKTDETGFLHVSMQSGNPKLVCEVLNNLYNEITDYYTTRKQAPGTKTIKKFQYKLDSISGLLASKQAALASFTDKNAKSIFAADQVGGAKLEHDIEVLTMMEGEAVKNYEMSKVSVENEQPFLKVLDLPRLPLMPTIPSLKKNLITGFALGLFLGITLAIIHRIIMQFIANKPDKDQPSKDKA